MASKLPMPTLHDDGFTLLPSVLTASQCAALIAAITPLDLPRAGSRHLLCHAACRELAGFLLSAPALHSLLPNSAVAVQCTLFDNPLIRIGLWPGTRT